MTEQELINAAQAVRKRAFAKYSGFHVGAALIDEQGRVHVGCNVENASYPVGTCAEAGAIAAMVAAGGSRIKTIAVVGGKNDLTSCTPCGSCRQRISEFAGDDTRVVVIDDDGDWHNYTLDDLLPHSFHLD